MPPARGGKSLVTNSVRRTSGAPTTLLPRPTQERSARPEPSLSVRGTDGLVRRSAGTRRRPSAADAVAARVGAGPADGGDVDRTRFGRGVHHLAVADVHRHVRDRRVVGDQVTGLQL